MAKRTSTSTKHAGSPGWWAEMDPSRRRRVILGALLGMLGMVALSAGAIGYASLERHVVEHQLDTFPRARVDFVDLPESLIPLAELDLRAAIDDLLDHRWTNDSLCRLLAERVAEVGWVARVAQVRRSGDAVFRVSAAYRLPAAMVHQGKDYFLVDADGVRLPGVYRFDPAMRVISGVTSPAPEAGKGWDGDEVKAGLATLAAISREPFARHIVGVSVDNYGGRRDRFAAHVELVTDRYGGRIQWGSPPGSEAEETSVQEKLRLLRANFAETGRPDAHHAIIDISAHTDRFIVRDAG